MKKWQVMKAHEEGAKIEARSINSVGNWHEVEYPTWDWFNMQYRVMKFSLEQRMGALEKEISRLGGKICL